MRKIKDHECRMVRPPEDVIKQVIDSGMFIDARRCFRSWCVVNVIHPETTKYYLSQSSRRQERIRHLSRYFYTVHPFSKLNLYWEFYMFVLYFLQFLSIPVNASMTIIEEADITWLRFILDTLQLADMTKLFFTGYYDETTNVAVLKLPTIAKHYVTTYFFFDFFSAIFIYSYPLRSIGLLDIDESTALWLRFFNRIKIVRLGRFLNELDLFRQYKGYSAYLFTALKLILIFFFVVFWSFAFGFSIRRVQYVIYNREFREEASPAAAIFRRYYDTIVMLVLAGFETQRHLGSAIDYLSLLTFICLGFALHVYIFVSIQKVWSRYTSSESDQQYLSKEIKGYSTFHDLPLSLRTKIFSYFQFKFYKQYFNESEIFNLVSPILKQEILTYITETYLENVELLNTLPKHVLLKVAECLKSEIYLPGDVIISTGTASTSMYFIYNGTLAVYAPTGEEVGHLEDGAHFGEIALVINETRIATVVATSLTELFILKRVDFWLVIAPYPQYNSKLLEIAVNNVQQTEQLEANLEEVSD